MRTYSLEKIEKWILWAGIISLAIFIPFSGFIQDLPYIYQLMPFFISMLFLGLPHGAMDHLVPSRLSNLNVRKSVTDVSALYALAGGLYTLWWFIDALTAFIFFIIMTWLHWGQGDLYAVKKLGKTDYLKTKTDKALLILVRGGIPMLVPLLAYPGLYERFATSVLSLFSENINYSLIFSEASRKYVFLLIGSLTVLNAVISFLRAYDYDSLSQWRYNQFEIIFLWIFFFSLPPVFAIGLYFCLWHSLRHITRLSLIDSEGMLKDLENGDYRQYIENLVRDTAPLTLISLVIIGIISIFMPGSIGNSESLIAVYLVGISVLTLPHFIIVSWMDHREGIWA